ncbi:uncharacterized protein Z518_02796 [Rhinocladiella mackenziei CBS 650.93]|uniref:Mur ligase central domain-containing protein n=1 Tax=Rhinocladiella mackenziei CBS 650.93 TaxID=1442369 RepID=A0A0D2JFR2_9EURO|nr:uncharacterized protein Z518_02796 [Rhinocladiella mackenziei CBS 650.93]KIX08140.1 hypothetical protein Z518_02796 [Rhinocladiella mackenziei CBS 650.93]
MINLGLQRISQLLNPLFTHHPTLPWKAVHIAGTNGKGSVASLISTFLANSGYKIGRFTSPPLIDRWDCIALNQHPVDRDRFLSIENNVKNRSVSQGLNASEFEILTAMAFQLFTDEEVDVAVVECGLGGRLDATNVLRPQDVLISVLTKVGLDHTEFLGDTVEAVAAEKAGIFKPGVPVVVDESNQMSVLTVVRDRLKELGWGSEGDEGRYLLSPERTAALDNALDRINLAKHQEQNVRTAYTAYELAELRLPPSNSSVKSTLETRSITVPSVDERLANTTHNLPFLISTAQSSLRGRLERLTLPAHLLPSNRGNESVPVLLDGMHNPQSAQALADYIGTHIRPRSTAPFTWVLSVKNDKDVRNILSILLKRSDNVVTCTFGPVDRMPWVKSMDATALAGIAREFTDGRVEVAPDGRVDEAIRSAVKVAGRGKDGEGGRDGQICIAGSLYLVSDVLRCVRDGETGSSRAEQDDFMSEPC